MTFFRFESEFVDSLRCIPMQVRFKLDTCGIKLKLHHWNQFTQDERQTLVEHPCSTAQEVQAYRSHLQQLIEVRSGEQATELAVDPYPEWENTTEIPASVQSKAQETHQAIALNQWAALTPLQRFALLKLSRSGHENRNFLPALQEFDLT
ncbi:MAG: nitrate reductase associated protein [Leptolyngbyaceae cyanobacterium bins.59]|nr:nitrate reductase associated protein [Leptolyngbyaceae cyanobacterium bins.59]